MFSIRSYLDPFNSEVSQTYIHRLGMNCIVTGWRGSILRWDTLYVCSNWVCCMKRRKEYLLQARPNLEWDEFCSVGSRLTKYGRSQPHYILLPPTRLMLKWCVYNQQVFCSCPEFGNHRVIKRYPLITKRNPNPHSKQPEARTTIRTEHKFKKFWIQLLHFFCHGQLDILFRAGLQKNFDYKGLWEHY